MHDINKNGTKMSLKTNAVLNTIRQSSSVILPLITFPYVSRVLGNIQYGRYSFSASIVTYFSLLSTYGISNYAIREGARIRDDKQKISELASDLFIFNIFTAIVAYTLLGLFVLFNTKVKDYALLIFIQSLCIILTMIGIDWVNTVFEDFLYITVRYIVLQLIALVFIFLFIKSPKDTAKYCLILVTASYGGNLLNLLYIRKYVKINIKRKINIKHYFLPLSILFVNSLATMIYVNSDITMLGFFKSDEAVGIYGFASKIYNVLKHLINAIIVVAVPRLAYLYEQDKEKYTTYINKIFKLLMFIIFPIAVIFSVFSDSIIYVAGGIEYCSGSYSFKILMTALIFALSASIFTNCILIINRLEKYCLISTIISAFTNVVLNLFMIPRWGITGAAVTTGIAEALNFIIQFYFTKKKLRITVKITIKDCSKILIGSAVVLLICTSINRFINDYTVMQSFLKVAAGTFLSATGYFISFITVKIFYNTFR